MHKMSEKIPAVSVIIPLYNAENFIGECLTSLLNQTLKNIEIIVVDDCSTDNSLAVTEKFIPAFEAKNKNLVTITLTQNSGCPGIPRNVALDYANGKYIYFIDSDDFLDDTALENFFNVAEKFNADVVHAEKAFFYEEINGEFQDKIFSTQTGEFVDKPTLETFDIAARVTDFIKGRYLWWGCNKLFRREFLLENEIKFPPITTFEDLIFTFPCVVNAKNYVRVPFVNYHYRIRKGSLSHGAPSTVSTSLNLLEAFYTLDSFMAGKKFFVENPKYRYAMLDFFAQIFLNAISENLFIIKNLTPAEVYEFYCREIFSLNPQKNIPLTTYLFTLTNIYKLAIKRQAGEIAQLKKTLSELQGS